MWVQSYRISEMTFYKYQKDKFLLKFCHALIKNHFDLKKFWLHLKRHQDEIKTIRPQNR